MVKQKMIKLLFLVHRLKAKGKYNLINKLMEKYGLERQTDFHD